MVKEREEEEEEREEEIRRREEDEGGVERKVGQRGRRRGIVVVVVSRTLKVNIVVPNQLGDLDAEGTLTGVQYGTKGGKNDHGKTQENGDY